MAETCAGIQRRKAVLDSSASCNQICASVQRENMADDEDAIYYYKNNDVYNIFTDEQINKTDQSQRSVYAGFQRRIEHCTISR